MQARNFHCLRGAKFSWTRLLGNDSHFGMEERTGRSGSDLLPLNAEASICTRCFNFRRLLWSVLNRFLSEYVDELFNLVKIIRY